MKKPFKYNKVLAKKIVDGVLNNNFWMAENIEDIDAEELAYVVSQETIKQLAAFLLESYE